MSHSAHNVKVFWLNDKLSTTQRKQCVKYQRPSTVPSTYSISIQNISKCHLNLYPKSFSAKSQKVLRWRKFFLFLTSNHYCGFAFFLAGLMDVSLWDLLAINLIRSLRVFNFISTTNYTFHYGSSSVVIRR